MFICQDVWSGGKIKQPQQAFNYGEILSRAPGQLIKILHACRLAPSYFYGGYPLLNIHFVLKLPWVEIREAICYLRPTIGEDTGALLELSNSTFPHPSDSIFSDPNPTFLDLAHGHLHCIASMRDDRLPRSYRQVRVDKPAHNADSISSWHITEWGRVVRSCPPCPKLLRNLRELELPLRYNHLQNSEPDLYKISTTLCSGSR
jgi:hypothetical protein